MSSYFCASPDHTIGCAAGDALRCYCLHARWAKEKYGFNLSASEVVEVESRYWKGAIQSFPLRRFCLSAGVKALPYDDNEVYNLGRFPVFWRKSQSYERCG